MTLPITATHLHLRYGDAIALDDINFTLSGGKIYGLLGRNGSGKTSLLSLLAGFRKPSGGTVLINGKPIFENGAITRQVCFVGARGLLHDKSDTLIDALDLGNYLRPAWDAAYALSLLEQFGLQPKQRIGELSLGQQSAFGIVVGLASRAPITLLDESYLGLDAPSRQQFQDALLADYMRHPRTFILSTHLIEEMSTLFEEVLIVHEGRLLLHDETEAVRLQGTAVTGAMEQVDRFVAGHTVINQKQLGRTKSAMIYGTLDDATRRQAQAVGLDVGAVPLQELFVHLTHPSGDAP
jgi:ABC-2 type transport system ATP-binding protein